MGVSKNRGTPKSSILIEFSIINHPFWGTPILGNPPIYNPFFFRIFVAGYEGAWLDNRAHGHGTFTESSGTSYEGTGKKKRRNDVDRMVLGRMDGCQEGGLGSKVRAGF